MVQPESAVKGVFSRRKILQGAAAGAAASVAATLFPGGASRELFAAQSSPAAGAAGAITRGSLPKRFSQAEMERRWAVARGAMKEQKFDGLLVTSRPDGSADTGWLTGADPQYAVLALSGKVLVIGGDSGKLYDGVEARTAPDDKYSEGIISAIKELSLASGRIGVGYLQDVLRLPEGGFNYTTTGDQWSVRKVPAKQVPKLTLSDLDNDPKRGVRPELGCSLVSWDVLVRDSVNGREIDATQYDKPSEGLMSSGDLVVLTGLNRGENTCTAAILWIAH